MRPPASEPWGRRRAEAAPHPDGQDYDSLGSLTVVVVARANTAERPRGYSFYRLESHIYSRQLATLAAR